MKLINVKLEFRFSKSPVTGETIFEITDFCDDDEVDESKWQKYLDEAP